jgi:hypothetical protein
VDRHNQATEAISTGLEIARIAICDTIHVRCDTIKILHRSQLRCKITEATDGEAVVFVFIHSSHLKFSIVILIAGNAFCHSVTIPIPCRYIRVVDSAYNSGARPTGPAIIESCMVGLGC